MVCPAANTELQCILMRKMNSLPSNHLRNDNLGHLHGGVDVNLNNVVDNCISLLLERGWDLMVGTDIVDCVGAYIEKENKKSGR